jgi:putative component of toxin-antitoxin plasmid stabilization module
MSIRKQWQDLVQQGQLFDLAPFPGDRRARTVLMSEAINKLVVGPWDDQAMGDRCARLTAGLQGIVRGNQLTVCMIPFAARQAQLGRLAPTSDSVFDLRNSEKPGLRVFCRFAEKNVLVALICAPRSVRVSWLDRLPLGDRYSKHWKRAVRETLAQWSVLFPKHDPVLGDNLDEYLTHATAERNRSGS